MTADEGPLDAVADLALVEGVDMARPIWFGSRKQKAALRARR
jgi:hypothetical protein